MPLTSPATNSGDQPLCSVIIPVYNGLEYIKACLEALFGCGAEVTFEVLVVDNGSTDGAREYLDTMTPDIHLLKPASNLGFSGANNLAARQARGKYLALLNSDTVPEPGWLDALAATLESDPKIAVVGTKLLYPDTRLIQHGGVAFTDNHKVFHIYENFPDDHPAVNRRRDFQVVTAACCLIRKDVYDRLGGLDERFRNGFEDVDFCLKAREAGYRVVYEPAAVVLHHAGKSPGRHASEIANSQLLTQLWRGKIRPDHREFYAEDGYTVEKRGEGWLVLPAKEGLYEKLEQARGHLKNGDLHAAYELYNEIYYAAPHSQSVMHYITDIAERRGDFEEADLMLRRQMKLDPQRLTLERLAANALKRKRYQEAYDYADQAMRKAAEDGHSSPEAVALLGDAAFKLGNTGEAAHRFNEALSIDPNHPRALTGAGTIALSRQDYQQALDIFEKILTALPHHPRGVLGKGLALLGLSRHSEAADYLLEALELDPHNSWALATLLPLLSETGRLTDAYDALDRHLRRYPDDNPMLLAQAGVAFALGRHDASRSILNIVKSQAPHLGGVADLERELERAASRTAVRQREPLPA